MPEPWKCTGCGIPSPDAKRVCDCPTNVVYYLDANDRTVTTWKIDPDDDFDLTHPEMCRLSRAFNESANLGKPQDARINEWLKLRIAEAFKATKSA